MRNGAKPRRRSPAAAPGAPPSPELLRPDAAQLDARPLPDETVGHAGDDVVDLLVRVSVDEPGDEGEGEREDGSSSATGADARAEGVTVTAPEGGSATGDVYLALELGSERARAVAAANGPAAGPGDQIRFARLHLRTGSLLQARSEFEALAACDRLDVPATLDLAEVRWRTGDLTGAGIAAAGYIAAGGDEALGFLIAAEAAASEGRVVEAGNHADRVLERSLSNLEVFFAGVPRRMNWPESSWTAPAPKLPPIAAVGPIAAPVGSLWAGPAAPSSSPATPW